MPFDETPQNSDGFGHGRGWPPYLIPMQQVARILGVMNDFSNVNILQQLVNYTEKQRSSLPENLQASDQLFMAYRAGMVIGFQAKFNEAKDGLLKAYKASNPQILETKLVSAAYYDQLNLFLRTSREGNDPQFKDFFRNLVDEYFTSTFGAEGDKPLQETGLDNAYSTREAFLRIKSILTSEKDRLR